MAALFIAVFLACVVEAVEALTIVLAAGTARDWRSAITGVVAGVVVLALIVAVLGPAVTGDPARWAAAGRRRVAADLRAAVVAEGDPAGERAQGPARRGRHLRRRARRRPGRARGAPRDGRGLVRIHAVVQGCRARRPGGRRSSRSRSAPTSGNIPLAASPRAAAVLVVAIAGIAVRAPLSRVPENSMKFAVGVMLTAFGIFWGAEGAGAHWPGEDVALLVLVPAVALYALALVALFKRRAPRRPRYRAGRRGG